MCDDKAPDATARLEWLLAALVKLQMAPILERELTDDFHRRLYALTGKATRRQIQQKLKCGPNRISSTWVRWEQMGIIAKDGAAYRRVT
jgi:hypothetical protein